MGASKEFPIADHEYIPCGCGDLGCPYCGECHEQKCFHVEPKTKSDFEKWKFAGSLPPVLILSAGHYPLADGAELGFDISAVQLDDRILMKQVLYTTPKRIHGLLNYESPTQLFFVGYDCGLCNEVFLVPDSVDNMRSLADVMKHGCMASPADSIAYYKHPESTA